VTSRLESKTFPSNTLHFDKLSTSDKLRTSRIGGPQAGYKTIRESLTEAVGAPFRRLSSVVRGQPSAVSNETLWALKDVSFEACPELSRRVQRGEVVGITSLRQAQHKRQPFDRAQDKAQYKHAGDDLF